MRLSNVYLGVLGVITIIVFWESMFTLQLLSNYLFPSIIDVFKLFFNKSFLVDILNNAYLTVKASFIGFIMALSIAIPLGLIIGKNKYLMYFLEPIIEFLRPMPSSAIIPIALLFFGLGIKMIVFVVAFGSSWPILVSTIQGVKSIDKTMLDTVKMLRLNVIDKIFKIILPASSLYIFAGLRTSLAVSLILAVTAEMIAGSEGIGFYILDMERAFRINEMYAGIVVIGIIGYLLNKIFDLIQKKFIYWV